MKMKLAAAALLLAASPAIADPAAPAPAAPTTAKSTPPASAQSAPFSRNTPFEVLVTNPATKATAFSIFPDIDKHPAWDMFKAMSPQQLTDSTGAIPEEKLAALDKALKDVK